MLVKIISERLSLPLKGVQGTVTLLEQGSTIPFISRYRKEVTGSLDEVQISDIKTLWDRLQEIESRKATILSTIESQGALTDELRSLIERCYDMTQLEDIYLPYKPKRRTRAMIARERGLEPLSELILGQRTSGIEQRAKEFISDQVATLEEAISGACDIIAEKICEKPSVRSLVRREFSRVGLLRSVVVKGKEVEGAKYSDYFDMTTPISRVSSHRLLAVLRGAQEGFLRVSIDLDNQEVTNRIARQEINHRSCSDLYIRRSIEDGYKRLLRPSIETESLSNAKALADEQAIAIFAQNLRQLLLASPLGQKRVLAIDPGFRTGCKVVALDSQGNLLHNTTIYPHAPQNKTFEATKTLQTIIHQYGIQAIAIGDGTASRESESLVRAMNLSSSIEVFMVSEDGASVYSASAVAREEFPDQDVTVRGSVSIGRRLIDPLSELVKIDPKSIGVGQYQHSVDQSKLRDSLSVVVESCVNSVGVNINTASKHLLTYVSGLGASLAGNIVSYRAENGDFRNRRDLLKVPRLGAKAFEQAAGFLRIIDGANPLDNTAVHPESYSIVKQMASDSGVSLEEFIENPLLRKNLDRRRYISQSIGLPTINDILEALDKRGLDPREPLTAFSFDPSVLSIEDLRVGMQLSGLVTNITAFGAFVDIGVKQDALVHISQLSDRYVSSVSDIVRLGDRLRVRVIELDIARKRISLSLKGL